MKKRVEKDSFGKSEVPEDAYYGVSTQRSSQNFHISRYKWHPELIKAITYLKMACAEANRDLGYINPKHVLAIKQACKEIIEGKLHDQFILDIFQAGSGTSTNMNANEVIANRTIEIIGGKKGDRSLVHPNDDINRGQSTNNVIPSSIRIASTHLLEPLMNNLEVLFMTMEKKAQQFEIIIKSARTHLQDAVPISLGQEFHGYAVQLRKHYDRLFETKKFLTVLGIGGNAAGTGLNTHPKFRTLILKYLNKETKDHFTKTKDGVGSTQFLTDIAALSSVLNSLVIDLNKIANDLRLLSSGPKTGLNEINLPPVEPGSSIMPGKINPTIMEVVNMVCHQVMGNNQAITISCASGNLDLNTHMPLIAHNITESLEILSGACFTMEKNVKGITANKEVCKKYAHESMALATALNPIIGYDKTSDLVKESLKTGKPIKDLVVEKKYLSKKEAAKVLDPNKLTKPNLK